METIKSFFAGLPLGYMAAIVGVHCVGFKLGHAWERSQASNKIIESPQMNEKPEIDNERIMMKNLNNDHGGN